ncbi:hypothetical protein [Oceanobacillus indicireducens]|uniref:Uncharacterized protein n=1 Tax=Oceanobacillus indicireducens TaxID=1004261 RepID=A0A917Y4C4_9BACI|nr:hypothetical protein [Oceanobacillus indicireducens]GGN67400.1 hypothetical protein GCM10007971_38210 [Oceanobacillus indicireducens]
MFKFIQLLGATLNIGRGGNAPEEKLTLFETNEPIKIGRFIVTVLPLIHSEPIKINEIMKIVNVSIRLANVL